MGAPGARPKEKLRRQGMEPRQPIGTADRDDVSVRKVDEGVALDQPTLFADDRPVVGRDEIVR